LGYYFSSRDKHLPQAELYLKQAIDIWDSLEYHIYSNNAQINLARLYVRLGKCNDAINLAMRGFENVKKYDWKWEEGYWYEILSMAYGKSKQYKEAYIYTEKAKERLLMNAYHQYNERLAYFSKQLDLKEKEEELILKQDEIYRTSQELRNKSKCCFRYCLHWYLYW
jgi:tetratricopeptide (TPR) repeat protein